MKLDIILDKIYSSKNVHDFFDSMCFLQEYIENNDNDIFYIVKYDKLVLNNDYSMKHIKRISKNEHFLESIAIITRYIKEYKEVRYIPNEIPLAILEDARFVNMSLNCCFYFFANFSEKLTSKNINYIGSFFWNIIKNIEKDLLYEFTKIDLLNSFELLIFDKRFFFKKQFNCKINGSIFFNNLKKTRLIVGNYIVDFSTPILLSSVLRKIIILKKIKGDQFSLKDAIHRLFSTVKKFNFFNRFQFEDSVDTQVFKNYFEDRESKKILFLINVVIDNLEDLTSEKILSKINNAKKILEDIKFYFYSKYSIFQENQFQFNEGQWSNKCFLNTIKFFSILDTINKSNNQQWKIDTFLRYFNEWIMDLDENINYFLELDDYHKIRYLLKSNENNSIEFKSTIGLPIQNNSDERNIANIKKEIINGIVKTILAMANCDGGHIFIGIVEKINMVNDVMKQHILEKDGINFLDIRLTLKMEGEDFDAKRLLIQQLIRNMTQNDWDFLDDLFSFHFYRIFIEKIGSCIEILDINVKKSERTIFIQKEDGKWITMPKRLNGRVELVNPSKEFFDKLIN